MSKTSAKSKVSSDESVKSVGTRTKSGYAFGAGVSLSIIFYLVVITVILQQGSQNLPLWDLYLFFIVLGLNLGFRVAKAMESTTRTSLFTLGFLSSFVLVFLVVYYTDVVQTGFEALISILFAFFLSFSLIKSEIVEEGAYDDVVKFVSGRLTWGVMTLHVVVAYTWPALDLMMSTTRTVEPSALGSFIILLVASIVLFMATFGGLEEGGWIRRLVKKAS